jgi:hypothetical protein
VCGKGFEIQKEKKRKVHFNLLGVSSFGCKM